MGGLRAIIEGDLKTTIESDFGLHVELIAPDGEIITDSVNDLLPLMAQVMYDTMTQDVSTGLDVVVKKPNVTLRKSSLSRFPTLTDYTSWFVRIPTSVIDSTLITYNLGRAPEGGESHGFIRLFLDKAIQKAP